MKLLRVPEVAALLDVPLSRAYEMVRLGFLLVVRIGRQVRVHPQRLEEWVSGGGTALASEALPGARGTRA